ncbi:uncharacterized protein LACBIDRAFT_316786 [Laccaria bicolor S238N-H82]|uniref:Predicted protein n=1 Tax=Laccaria bicolor (strain S238N-H82 / ATCC MYA-4686) TaxID=486041 RepID=B0E1L9_LACBS|nr:uncharacterized protein LACBIDRAFT_316786 [Laccaria bicolor S238N-H82]EDQ99287.1 predicted protein [Laccaria bicolor S238N-H82]|eukprot:XP_001890097.1 predicted protein [Laccaria bicolor S238N-H82]
MLVPTKTAQKPWTPSERFTFHKEAHIWHTCGCAAQRHHGSLNTNSGILFLFDWYTDDGESPYSFRNRCPGKTQKSIVTMLIFNKEPATSYRQMINI